jgi:hypothetical protein
MAVFTPANGLLGLALLRFTFFMLRVVWRIVKLLVFVGVLYGIWLALKPLPIAISVVPHSLHASWGFVTAPIRYVADNWFPIASGVIFFVVIQTRRSVNQASKEVDGRTLKILLGTVTLMSYLNIELETDLMAEQRAMGWWKTMKKSWTEQLLIMLLGFDPVSDELTARAVRSSTRASLAQDIEAQLGKLAGQPR